MGEYADELVDRMVHGRGGRKHRPVDRQSVREAARYHAERNRLAAEAALDELDELEADED